MGEFISDEQPLAEKWAAFVDDVPAQNRQFVAILLENQHNYQNYVNSKLEIVSEFKKSPFVFTISSSEPCPGCQKNTVQLSSLMMSYTSGFAHCTACNWTESLCNWFMQDVVQIQKMPEPQSLQFFLQENYATETEDE